MPHVQSTVFDPEKQLVKFIKTTSDKQWSN